MQGFNGTQQIIDIPASTGAFFGTHRSRGKILPSMAVIEADIANIQLGAVQPGASVQFTVMVQPTGAKVQGVQVTVVGLPDYSAILSANGLSITVNVPKGTPIGTLVMVTWVCGLASATAQFTVGGA